MGATNEPFAETVIRIAEAEAPPLASEVIKESNQASDLSH
jgi:hypothetical protein